MTGNLDALSGRDWGLRTDSLYVMGDDTSPRDGFSMAAAQYPSPASSHGTHEASSTSTTTSTQGSAPGRCPSRYDWSKHMSAIKRLYIDEDKPLKEVMEIMQKEHNFIAT